MGLRCPDNRVNRGAGACFAATNTLRRVRGFAILKITDRLDGQPRAVRHFVVESPKRLPWILATIASSRVLLPVRLPLP